MNHTNFSQITRQLLKLHRLQDLNASGRRTNHVLSNQKVHDTPSLMQKKFEEIITKILVTPPRIAYVESF